MYRAIRECSTEKGYGIDEACDILHASRSAYYKWASGKWSPRIMQNEMIAREVEKIHMESPDKGYRRINDELRHDHHIHVNDKRILRICRAKDIKSTIKYRNMGCTRRAKNPQHTAENLLNRQFHADRPNEKWLIDVTEFKYWDGNRTQKLYLSASSTCTTDASLPMSSVTGMTTLSYSRLSTRQWKRTRMRILCSTATGASSTRTGHSTTSLKKQA